MSMKSLKPKKPRSGGGEGGGRNPSANLKGQKRSNGTHRSTTNPDAMLYRTGARMGNEAVFHGRRLIENRSGLLIDARLTRVLSHAERLATLDKLCRSARRDHAGARQGLPCRRFLRRTLGGVRLDQPGRA